MKDKMTYEAKKVRLESEASFFNNRADYYTKVIRTIRGEPSVVKLNVESPFISEPCWIIIPTDKAIAIVEEQLKACEERIDQTMNELRGLK